MAAILLFFLGGGTSRSIPCVTLLCSYCNLNVSFLGPIILLRQLDAEAQSHETLVYTGAFLLGLAYRRHADRLQRLDRYLTSGALTQIRIWSTLTLTVKILFNRIYI